MTVELATAVGLPGATSPGVVTTSQTIPSGEHRDGVYQIVPGIAACSGSRSLAAAFGFSAAGEGDVALIRPLPVMPVIRNKHGSPW